MEESELTGALLLRVILDWLRAQDVVLTPLVPTSSGSGKRRHRPEADDGADDSSMLFLSCWMKKRLFVNV